MDRIFRWTTLVSCAGMLACSSPPAPAEDGGGPPTECTTAADCDDGLFCNGPESCLPGDDAADARGCVAMPPCEASQRCLEAEDRCVTSCAVNPDADGDGVDAVTCGGADCDDADARTFPGNVEVCDLADHDEDCDPATYGGEDADGDGFDDAACCNVDAMARRFCGDDCNDHRRDAHPGSTEACEGVDNDCDGAIDEGLLVAQYVDADFDLHGATGARTDVCPGTPGWSTVADDCDDASPLRHAAQLEICDGVDNDCDGVVDEAPVAIAWYPDEDGDLFGAPPDAASDIVISCAPVPGYSTRSSDCDDGDALVRPGAREICNAIDDDCNGRADAPGLMGGDTEDDDEDGYADVVCGGGDCDDSNASVHSGADELCNGVDDDCDGTVDGDDAMAMWYLDLDRDGWGTSSAASPPIVSCDPQAGRVTRGGDCDDGSASVHPRTPDFCDEVDADCDGAIDENGIRFAFFPDADGDGWGTSAPASIVFACTQPAGTAARPGDCADTDAARYPTALEQCQALDDDCDGTVDEDSDRMWFADADGDGHGVGTPILACMRPAGRAPLGDDCDDADGGRFPGNTERCDGADDDCDASVDEGAASACDGLHGTGVCTAGACAITCMTGYGDCDGDVSTGCEADTTRSATDCGMCDVSCGLADSCGRAPGAPGVCNDSPIVELVGFNDFVIGRRATGGTFGWGRGTLGQHLLGTSADYAQPGAGQLDSATQLAAGDRFACAVVESGAVTCWGMNDSGQLAVATLTSRTAPGVIPLPGPAAAVCGGYDHACAVLRDGTAWCWGSQTSGRLGNGTTAGAVITVPAQMRSAAGLVTDAVGISCGAESTCVLRERSPGNRYVSCAGANDTGQLAQGSTSPASSGLLLDVPGLPTTLVRMNRGSAPAHCVLTATGRASCWGSNSSPTGYGISLGLGGSGTGGPQTTPVTAPGLDSNVVDIMIHDEGGCAIRAVGAARELWCWGYTLSGAHFLGNGSTNHVFQPALVGPIGDPFDDVTAMTVGYTFLCAVRPDGVWCIGADAVGQLGNGVPLTGSGVPVQVSGLP